MNEARNDPAKELDPAYPRWVSDFLKTLPPQRQRKVLGFLEYLELKGTAIGTRKRYIQAIRTMGNGSNPYEKLTRGDLIAWMQQLPSLRFDGKNNGKLGEGTVRVTKLSVKHFLRWCHNGDARDRKAPKMLDCIKYKNPQRSLRKQILNKGEIRKLVDACESQRDRALVFVGYESGARAGELLSLRLRDVEFDRYGAVVVVKGKTGERRIRLVESVPDLQLWLNIHPQREDPETPLWPSFQNPHRAIPRERLYELLGQLAAKTGMKKHIHPHLLRHTRATHLANVLTEAQMREFFGWTKNSDMPSIYVHLSGRDVDRTLLQAYGIKIEPPEITEEPLAPRRCPRCGFESPARFKFCGRCSMALDMRTETPVSEPHEGAEELVAEFIRRVLKRAPELAREILENEDFKRVLGQMLLVNERES
jgi:integrase